MDTSEYTVTSVQTAPSFRMRRIESTSDPLLTVPSDERWLWQNFEAMQSLARGKADVRAGRVHDLGSFAQFIDLDTDD